MSMTKVEAFRIFLDKMPEIRAAGLAALAKYKAEFDENTELHNPPAASEYAQIQLDEIKVDEQQIDLYDAVADFVEKYIGDGVLAEDVPLVEDVTDFALHLSNSGALSGSAMQVAVDAITEAVGKQLQRDFLCHFLERNADKVIDFRLRLLEEEFGDGEDNELDEDEEPTDKS